jgi:Chain length determinant protein
MATTSPKDHSYLRVDDDVYLRLGDLVSPEPAEGPSPAESLVPVGASGDAAIRAIARHKKLIACLGVLVAIAGAGIGVVRKPTYTSSTTLQVGTVNLNSPNFYGFVQSASDIATVFSRSITAAPVLADIKSRLGIGPGEATRRLSAAPIPLSPGFRIIATGSTAGAAISLANTASNAVIAYESHAAGATTSAPEPILKEYVQAAESLQNAFAIVTQLTQARKPGSGEDAAMIQARSALDAARIHAAAVGAVYQSALLEAKANTSTGLVSLVAGASTASGDRGSKSELFGFVGLLAGLVAGTVLAVLYEQRKARRSSQ